MCYNKNCGLSCCWTLMYLAIIINIIRRMNLIMRNQSQGTIQKVMFYITVRTSNVFLKIKCRYIILQILFLADNTFDVIEFGIAIKFESSKSFILLQLTDKLRKDIKRSTKSFKSTWIWFMMLCYQFQSLF